MSLNIQTDPTVLKSQNKKEGSHSFDENNPKYKSIIQRAGFFSYLHFSFVYSIIKKARELHQKGLSLKSADLPSLGWHERSETLGQRLLSALEKQKAQNKKARLEILLFKTFTGSMLLVLLGNILAVFLRIIMVWFAKNLLDSLADPSQPVSDAFKWASILCASLIIAVYNENHYFYLGNLLMTRIRISLISAIYTKITRMSLTSLNQISIGKIVNIVANDVNVFENIGIFFTTIIVGPLGLIAGAAMLWSFFGPTCLVGIGFLAFTFPIQQILVIASNGSRDKRNNLTDERIKLTNELVEGIRLLKMYTWETIFRDKIKDIRKTEVGYIKKVLACEGASQGFSLSAQFVASFLIFLTYVLTGGELTVSKVFPTLFLIGYMKMAIIMFFAIALNFFGEVSLFFPRTLEILEAPETAHKPFEDVKDSNNSVELDNFTAYWQSPGQEERTSSNEKKDWEESILKNSKKKPVLSDITLNLKKGSLNALVGKVGCGKTSFLLAFTGEIPVTIGHLRYHGKVAYVEQEATIFSGLLRDNILFGRDYEPEFYWKVINACGLDSDMKEFPNGDLTEIGERGINLSGGQKARVALARAIYSDADIYLLDDPLSAVDTKVAKKLYQEVIKGLLKEKTVILATHQVHFVKDADQIIIMQEGKIVESGTYSKLQSKQNEEQDILGTITKQGESENSARQKENKLSIQGLLRDQTEEPLENEHALNNKKNGSLFTSEDEYMGKLNVKTYISYFADMNSGLLLILVFFIFLGNELANIAFSRVLGVWAKGELEQTSSIVIVAGITAFLVASYIIKTILSYILAVRAANNLHNKILDRIVRCPIEFFDTNPLGRILNRFSNDLGVMDKFLPWTFCDVFEVAITSVTMLITVAVISPLTLIPVVLATFGIMMILKVCYQSVKQSKDYELASHSPVYSMLSSTLAGVTVVRSYHQENKFKQHFTKLLNDSAKGSFIFWSLSRWYGFHVDLFYTLSTVVSILTITSFKETQPELVGLALSFILSITGFIQFGVKGAVEINILMSSVARIQAYCKLPLEANLVTGLDESLERKKWPQQGRVSFDNVHMKYRKNTPNVIKGLSFEVHPGEKIGCIGRTGAGKSSIIQLLFRMVEINHDHEDENINSPSSIKIDDTNTQAVGLHLLRKSISIIPQTPFIFTGTIRRNLDPLGLHGDEELWEVLEEVNLKHHVEKFEDKLYTDMTNVSSVFSTGQKQLVCLARTILKHSRILVLDEATANVDYETDNFIQRKVQEKFKNRTTFTIAHRLSTIANYDKVLVLEKGKLAEFDAPYRLLVKEIGDKEITNISGHFSSMVLNTGPKLSREIFEIARKKYMELSQLDAKSSLSGGYKYFS